MRIRIEAVAISKFSVSRVEPGVAHPRPIVCPQANQRSARLSDPVPVRRWSLAVPNANFGQGAPFASNWTSLSEALRRRSLAAQLLHAGSVTDSANPGACSLFWAAILPMELTNHIEDGPALIQAYRTDPANPLAHSAHPAGG